MLLHVRAASKGPFKFVYSRKGKIGNRGVWRGGFGHFADGESVEAELAELVKPNDDVELKGGLEGKWEVVVLHEV